MQLATVVLAKQAVSAKELTFSKHTRQFTGQIVTIRSSI